MRYRMVGAIVLILVAVLLLPWMFDGAGYESMQGLDEPIPPRPEFVVPQTPSATARLPMQPRADPDLHVAEPQRIEAVPTAQRPAGAEPVTPARSAGQAATRANAASEPNTDAVGWAVQVGSFGREANAREQAQQLLEAGFPAFVERASANGRGVWRVKVGPRAQRDAALRLRDEIQRGMEISGIVVAHP